jgi:hypothetical protein
MDGSYKDRKAGLIFFGILTLLIGLIDLLFVPLMLLAPKLAASQPNSASAPAAHQVFFSAGTGLLLAIVFIWLGIGSILTRRWARALILIGAWAWLIIGIFSLGWLIFMWPQMQTIFNASQAPGQAPLPDAARSMIAVVMIAFVAFIYIIVPAVWILFYRSRHVKATCEARDPRVRWTDRCPLPVLALALWSVLSAMATFTMALFYNQALPFFGLILSGLAGTICYLIIAAIWFYAGWSIYKLRRVGWWIAFIGMVIWPASAFLTWRSHSIAEVLAKMDLTSAQARQVSGLMSYSVMSWSAVAIALPMLAYLLYVRRYFRMETGALSGRVKAQRGG